MKATLTWHQVAATPWGRAKLWCLYGPPRALIRLLPSNWQWPVIRAARRQVFGPNANNEDLNALIRKCREAARS